ncbi:PAS domain-containing protein [Halobaculum sp. MBLA0143]|uniref:PAS domain-containing protein n=1 Tax=Halobaculum sp. MBLA0143 TaxID=3079933 RepID=UPI003525479B
MRPTRLPPEAAVAGLTTLAAAGLVWRLDRSESSVARGLRPVVAVVAATALAVGVAALPADVAWHTPVVDEIANRAVTGLLAAVSVPWLRFVLRYTGRDRLAGRPLQVGLATAFVCLTAAGAFVTRTGGPTPETVVSVAGASGLLIARGIVAVVAVTVAWGSVGDTSVPTGQGFGLAVVALLPTASSIVPGVVALSTALAGSVGLLWVIVARYDPFERVPAASLVGRDRAIAEMSAAVVVADDDGVIRDLNTTAESVFGPTAAAVGEPLSAVAPSLVAGRGADFRTRTDAGRHLAVSVTTVTDDRGDRAGRLFVCRDVTDRRQRERRLRLVTQLLADTVHDRMSAVAETASRRRTQSAPHADPEETATTLTTVVGRVRSLERALADGGADGPVGLSTLLAEASVDWTDTSAVDWTDTSAVDWTDTSAVDDTDTSAVDDGVTVAAADAPLVRTAVESLTEATTGATVTATTTADGVEIRVAGDRPTDAAGVDAADVDAPDVDTTSVDAIDPDAAVAVARIVADTLGGSVTEHGRTGVGTDDGSSAGEVGTDDPTDPSDAGGWAVTLSVPVRDGRITVPARRGST